MKRHMKRKLTGLIALVMTCLIVLSGCGNGSADNTTPSPDPTENGTEATAKPEEPTEEQTPEPAIDPFAKFDPPVTVTAGRILTSWMSFDEGEDLDNNWWMRAFREQLGVDVQWDWTAPNWGEPYEQKIYLGLATNDLPDYLCVYGSIFAKLSEAGKLEDFTEAYEKYASPYLKELMEADNGLVKKSGTVGGKLLGVGKLKNIEYNLIFIRKDWLDNLNLPVPTTFEELEATALAFATQDPDGNGKPDTYGVPMDKEIRIETLYDMFNIKRGWVEKDGELVPYTLQEENKALWQKLADWYKQGIISPEFSIKDVNNEIVQDLINGKYGIRLGGNLGDPQVKDQRKANPNSTWVAIAPPTVTNGVAKFWQSSKVGDFNIATTGANMEAAVKMLNLILQCYHPTEKPAFVTSYDYQNTEQGSLSFFMRPFSIEPRKMGFDPNLFNARDLLKAGGDPVTLSFEAQSHYKELKAFADGDMEYWNLNEELKEGGFHDMRWKYISEGNIYYDPAFWVDTPAEGEFGGGLSTRYQEFVTRAIMEDDVENQWNAWVDYYLKNGGATIIAENNALYQANK